MKYIFLILIVFFASSCREQINKDSSQTIKSRIDTIAINSNILIVSNLIIENLSSPIDSLRLLSEFNILESSSKNTFNYKISQEEYFDRLKFIFINDLPFDRKLLVYGMNNNDNEYNLILLNHPKNSIDWQVASHIVEYTRLSINESDILYDSVAKLIHFTVEQQWSSDGSLNNEIFYKVDNDTLRKVLETNCSGGADFQIANQLTNGCKIYISTDFSSEIVSILKEKIIYNYSYKIKANSNCDANLKFEENIFSGNDTITYVWNQNCNSFVADWNSLNYLDSVQFNSITTWNGIRGFNSQIVPYCNSIQDKYPISEGLIRNYFLK